MHYMHGSNVIQSQHNIARLWSIIKALFNLASSNLIGRHSFNKWKHVWFNQSIYYLHTVLDGHKSHQFDVHQSVSLSGRFLAKKSCGAIRHETVNNTVPMCCKSTRLPLYSAVDSRAPVFGFSILLGYIPRMRETGWESSLGNYGSSRWLNRWWRPFEPRCCGRKLNYPHNLFVLFVHPSVVPLPPPCVCSWRLCFLLPRWMREIPLICFTVTHGQI